MIVTEIKEFSKARCKIYIENEFAFVLYQKELSVYHVREGAEIETEAYQRILREVLPKRAKLRAINLLKSRDYTTEQLRRKLQQGGYPEEVVEQTLEYVQTCHYTDDLRYAVQFITCYEERKSRRRICQDLYAKGISGEILEQAWKEWERQGGCYDEQAMIKKLLDKKKYDGSAADDKEKQRIYAFLLRRGFSAEQVRKALKLSEIENSRAEML